MGLGEAAFKKAIRSRTHRERAQPASRAKLGLLEKHKDYVLRARDYHKKQTALKALKVRASNRNPDEFHFGMIKSRFLQGRHMENYQDKTKTIPADMLKLMKTQDVAYITLQKNANRKKLEEAEQELAIAEAAKQGSTIRTHVYFAEDDEEKETILSRLPARDQDNMIIKSDGDDDGDDDDDDHGDLLEELEESPMDRELEKKRQTVEVRRQRMEQLGRIEHKMRLDRHLLSKGRRQKIGTDEYGFAKYKWAVERKK